MKFLCFFAIFTTIFSLLLIHYYDPVFGIIVSTIFYGLSNSILFALSYTISQEFNLKLSPSQSSDFMISAALG